MLSDLISTKSLALMAAVVFAGFVVIVATYKPDMPELKFNKGQWVVRQDANIPDVQYPYRDQMLNDLVKHHQLKGLTYKQLVDSIGEPSNYGQEDDGIVHYLVFEGFESDIDPVHGKTLDLTLGPDSVVTSYKVSEW